MMGDIVINFVTLYFNFIKLYLYKFIYLLLYWTLKSFFEFFSADGRIILSVDKDCCKHYYLMKTLKTEVVSVAFYGTILALGGENGRLFLYYLFSEEQLISLDLSKPNATLKLSEASIISIDITYQDDTPVIAASTNDSIHIVKWYKLSMSHQRVRRRELSHLFPWFTLGNNTCLRFCDNCKFCMNIYIIINIFVL